MTPAQRRVLEILRDVQRSLLLWARKSTIDACHDRGWIVLADSKPGYELTDAGRAALEAK